MLVVTKQDVCTAMSDLQSKAVLGFDCVTMDFGKTADILFGNGLESEGEFIKNYKMFYTNERQTIFIIYNFSSFIISKLFDLFD